MYKKGTLERAFFVYVEVSHNFLSEVYGTLSFWMMVSTTSADEMLSASAS